MRSAVPVLSVDVDVDVKVAGSAPCFEPRHGFLELKTFVFISLLIKVKEKISRLPKLKLENVPNAT